MALPPSEELSRWTVSHVSNWLTKCSLSVFRDDFLRDSIDGSKLLRMPSHEVNQKYKHIHTKKRNILIDHLKKIESARQPPTWNAAPNLPPRFGANSRMPPPQPVQSLGDSDGSDGSWPDEFDEDDDDDVDDYLEPAPKALDDEPPSGYNTNGNMLEGPDEAYEIPEEDLEEIRQQPQLERQPTIVDRLRDELVRKKNREDQSSTLAAPPPRPPRSNRGASPRSMSPAHHHSPMPIPPVQNLLPSDDMYEAMNDVITETQKTTVQHFQAAEAEANLPPRPTKRGVKERPMEPQPAEKPAQRARQPYTEVKKPGRLVEQDELSGYDWSHGKIGRDHAQRIFEREQQDGMFLIRKSERGPKQPYTLVIWHVSRIWNLPIRKKDDGNYAAGKYKDGESEFTSVPELVEHFKVVSLNLKSNSAIQGTHNLTVPAPKH